MFSLKRLLSFTVSAAVMLSAGAPAVSAAGVSVSPAAEAAVSGKVSAGYAPDWVPETYLDALEFSNKYGATHVEGQYACVVQQRSKSENAFYAMECVAGNSNNNISYDFSGNLYFSAEDAPDKSDTEAYEAYLKRLKAAGISEDTTELDNYFRVEVYESIFSGFDVTLEEGYYSGDDLVINSSNVYSFGYYLSLFNLEERDIFSFMPDSVEEYDEFIKEHGNVCAFNDYVIYCGDVPRYSGVELQMEQNGNARIKEFKSYTIGERVADMGNISDGGSVRTVRMYEGIDWGEVNVDFNLVRFDNTVVQKASNNFTIERDEAQRVDFSIVMNRDDLPEWVPTDYAEALAFENEHGSSYIADGYICCMRRLRRNGKKRIYFSESAHNVIDDCQVCSKVFRFPSYDENEQGSYEKYLADLEKLGLDERTAENANKDIFFTVDVFKPKPSTEVKVYFDDYRGNMGKGFGEDCRLSFETDKDGVITETDHFSWVPDSVAETKDYIKKNGNISVHGEYAVFCAVSNAFSLDIKKEGIPAFVETFNYYLDNTQLIDVLGSPFARVILYKADKPGTMAVDFGYSGGRGEFEPKDSEVCFRFDNDLNASIISREECVPPVLGDCNNDGVFGISDVIVLQQWLLGRSILGSEENADMNKDGFIDIFDLISMKKQIIRGDGGSCGIVTDPKPMLVEVSENYAWGQQQYITIYDENGAGYEMVYSESAYKDESNVYDKLLHIGYDEDWYERLVELMNDGNAKRTLMPDELVADTRKLSAEISQHLGDAQGEHIGRMFDAGQGTVYLIGMDSDGKPACLELFTTGDVLGWIACEELQSYLKKMSYTRIGPDQYEIQLLEGNTDEAYLY